MIEIRQTEVYAKWFVQLKDIKAKARINARIRRLSIGNAGDVQPAQVKVSLKSGLTVGLDTACISLHEE